jgi:chemotaxis protein CheD
VGRKNAEFVVEFLKMEAINITSQDLGGHESRRIYLHTDTGKVLLNRIFCRNHPNIALAERKLLENIRDQAEKQTDVTLF